MGGGVKTVAPKAQIFFSPKGSITFQERRNFQVGSPPQTSHLIFFFDFFFIFPKDFHFPIEKKKKRGAAGAEKKNAEAPQAPRKKIYKFFPILFYFDFFFFSKNNLQNFGNFGNFELFFFLLWFPLEKCLLVQSAFSAALVG